MKIAVLSGKGGTGKTTVATNLACVLGCHYMDCDVEEPNGHIFLKPEIIQTLDATLLNPVINANKCSNCGLCAKACQFNALVKTDKGILIFNELCHGCGVCKLVCPSQAIAEYPRRVGEIKLGTFNNKVFSSGKLDIKEPMGVPIIRKLHDLSTTTELTLVDSSPGTSCTVVNALEGAVFGILVTEPTKFGLHDLKLAITLLEEMKIPHGILVNRSNGEDLEIMELCERKNIPLIGQIPFSRRAAELYSRGGLLIEDEEFLEFFKKVVEKLKGILAKEVVEWNL